MEAKNFKVGQVWRNRKGTNIAIVEIDDDLSDGLPILGSDGAWYRLDGTDCIGMSEFDLIELVRVGEDAHKPGLPNSDMSALQVKIKRTHQDAILPKYATDGAACFDLHAIEGGQVQPFFPFNFRTGLSVEIPPGHVMLIYSRSGHGFKNGLRLSNCVGVIDSDYRGEIAVKIHNDSPHPFDFSPGDRIAQAMILPIPRVALVEVYELSDTERGTGGFGSTGQ